MKQFLTEWKKYLNEAEEQVAQLVPVAGYIDESGNWKAERPVQTPGVMAGSSPPFIINAFSGTLGDDEKGPLSDVHVWEYFGRLPNTPQEFNQMIKIIRSHNAKSTIPNLRNPEALSGSGKGGQSNLQNPSSQGTLEQQLFSYVKTKAPNLKASNLDVRSIDVANIWNIISSIEFYEQSHVVFNSGVNRCEIRKMERIPHGSLKTPCRTIQNINLYTKLIDSYTARLPSYAASGIKKRKV